MNPQDPILVTGARGMVGSAVVRALEARGFSRVLAPSRSELDCTNAAVVEKYLRANKPAAVFIAAARVGGIHANSTYPAEFIYENLAIATNLVHQSWLAGIKRVLFLGSSCIYPREAPQPIREDYLLTGPLETTNEAYAVAKIAGLKLCQFYRQQYGVTYYSAMPTNLYGPGDNYHPQNSHVLPALIRRFHEAKVQNLPEVVLWGTGKPRREFLHVDDAAAAMVHLLLLDNPPDLTNIGCGEDVTIRELAEIVLEVVGFKGKLRLDTSKPDGTPRKLLDVTRLRSTGWAPKIGLREGIAATYQCFLREQEKGALRIG